eukprot:COSAG05_NODE_411_length_10106_cov_31.037873_8_plen_202_part_00
MVVAAVPNHKFVGLLGLRHGGDTAAGLAEKLLLAAILRQPEMQRHAVEQDPATAAELLSRAMVAGFVDCDAEIRPQIECSGTTAVCCFLTPSHIICANAGDARAVYCKVDAGDEVAGPKDNGPPNSNATVPCLQEVTSPTGNRASVTYCQHVSCLKAGLKSFGVDYSRCVEKHELISLLQASQVRADYSSDSSNLHRPLIT